MFIQTISGNTILNLENIKKIYIDTLYTTDNKKEKEGIFATTNDGESYRLFSSTEREEVEKAWNKLAISLECYEIDPYGNFDKVENIEDCPGPGDLHPDYP